MGKRVLLWVFILLSSIDSLAGENGRIQGQVRKAGTPVDGVDVVLKELSLSTITDNCDPSYSLGHYFNYSKVLFNAS
jgi:hypothetical protein